MSEETVESLKAELEAAKTALEEAKTAPKADTDRDRLAYLEGENKKLIEARDEAKRKKREAEEAHLAEQGEFKTLAETRAKELEDLTVKLESLNGKVSEYQKRDEEELSKLLEGVPEALRDDVADDSLPLEKRLALARKLTDTKTVTKPVGVRLPGEDAPTTLQAQYDAALKSGDVPTQLRLKREIHEAAKG
jgi:small-conductance mechanosensitive channel